MPTNCPGGRGGIRAAGGVNAACRDILTESTFFILPLFVVYTEFYGVSDYPIAVRVDIPSPYGFCIRYSGKPVRCKAERIGTGCPRPGQHGVISLINAAIPLRVWYAVSLKGRRDVMNT